MQLIKNKEPGGNDKNKTGSLLGKTALFTAILFLCNEVLAFDIKMGVKAATDPLFGAVENHWGKIIFIVAVSSALIGEGDLRTRAIWARMTAGSSKLKSNQLTNKKERE